MDIIARFEAELRQVVCFVVYCGDKAAEIAALIMRILMAVCHVIVFSENYLAKLLMNKYPA